MSENSQYPTIIPRSLAYLAPPQHSGELGRLAQYRIVKQLGRGGMGLVFLAEDMQLGRFAALKVMHPDYAAQDDARARFLREARAAAALKHDHVVTIYQVGEEQGVPFLAMELLKGKSLEEWLPADRPASMAETLLIGKQIARGLAAAHAAGLIHRDIKPANLWLEAPRGRVKILDFGLARAMGAELAELTQDGSVLGTPAYMAPEQARGDTVDARCDLFSLGCVLYRMLAGHLPFQGNSAYAVLAAIASVQPRSVNELRPEIPLAMSSLIDRLLAKQAANRPASAQAVFDELVAIEKATKQSESGPLLLGLPEAKRNWKWMLGLASVAALLVIAASVWAMTRNSKAPLPPKVAVETVVAPPDLPPEQPSIDLLSLVKIPRDVRQGKWDTPVSGTFRGKTGRGVFTLALPWEPPNEYRLRVRTVRVGKEHGQLFIGLGRGDERFVMMFDAQPRLGHRSALGMIDGAFITERSGSYHGLVVPPRTPVLIEITVRNQGITVEVDGKRIYAWPAEGEEADYSRLGRPLRQPEDALFLGGIGEPGFLFNLATLQPLGEDSGKSLAK